MNNINNNKVIYYGLFGLILLSLIELLIYYLFADKLYEFFCSNKAINLINYLAGYKINFPERGIKILINTIFASLWLSYLVLIILIYLILQISKSLKFSTKSTINNIISFLAITLVYSLLLCWSAFYNKFPLVFFDSGTYINNARPLDRPVGYYLFILFTSFRISLWLTIFCQAFITSLLLIRNTFLMLSFYSMSKNIKLISLSIILIFLIIFTDISKYISWIMPDIFTSWLFLGMMLFLLSSEWYDNFLSLFVIAIAFITHGSNLPIFILSLTLLIIIGLLIKSKNSQILAKSLKLTYLSIFLALCLCVLNFGLGLRFTPSRGDNFILSKFISSGILSKTLSYYCPTQKWSLCKYKDKLDAGIGKNGDWFLWDKESPIEEMGNIWEDDSEKKEIIKCALRLFYPEIIKNSLLDTLQILTQFDSNDGLCSYSNPDKGIYNAMLITYPNEHQSFLNSRQQKWFNAKVNILPIDNQLLAISIVIVTLICLIIFIIKKDKILISLLLSSCIFIFFNGLITGSCSAVVDRYNTRVFWLLAYCLLTTIVIFIYEAIGVMVKRKKIL